MFKVRLVAVVALAVGVLPAGPALSGVEGRVEAGGQFGWLKGGDKPPEFQPFRAPSQRFTVEYPKRDWDVSAGGNGEVTFKQKKSEAVVTIQHDTLEVELAPSDITERTAENEIERIRGQLPKATGFQFKVREENGRPIVVVDYMRPDVRGGVERARQYSIISGRDLYRIVCSGPPPLFDKYEPVFKHVTDTFKPAPAAGGGD